MKRLLFMVVAIAAGIMASSYVIESKQLTQGPEARPAAYAQQLDDRADNVLDEDQIRTMQAAPTEISE